MPRARQPLPGNGISWASRRPEYGSRPGDQRFKSFRPDHFFRGPSLFVFADESHPVIPDTGADLPVELDLEERLQSAETEAASVA
jgi:hypothetical protein